MTFTTKQDYAYMHIKEDILSGKLRPDSKLVTKDLAEHYGMSFIPIREALTRLNNDGLINVIPYVGAKVAHVNLKEFLELSLMRTDLECLAVRLAIPYLEDKHMHELFRIQNKLRTLYEAREFGKYTTINRTFYLSLYNYAPYPQLHSTIDDLFQRTRFNSSVLTLAPKRREESLNEHEVILKAMESRDPHIASCLLRAQKHRSYIAMMEQLRTVLSMDIESALLEFFFSKTDISEKRQDLIKQVDSLNHMIQNAKE